MTPVQKRSHAVSRENVPGSRPLKNCQHEKFAREIAAGASRDRVAQSGQGPGKRKPKPHRSTPGDPRTHRVSARRVQSHGRSQARRPCRRVCFGLRISNVIDFFETDLVGVSAAPPIRPRLRLRDLTSLPRSVTASITELHIDEDGKLKLKTADKLHAIDSLIKTIGGFAPEKAEGRGTTLEDIVMASMEMRDQARINLNVVTGVLKAAGPVNHGQRAVSPSCETWRSAGCQAGSGERCLMEAPAPVEAAARTCSIEAT